MTTTIDHSVRKRLNISSVHYIVAQTCAQFYPLLKETGISILSQYLGLSTAAVRVAMDDLRNTIPALLEKKENGFYYPTIHWYSAHDGEEVTLTSEAEEVAKFVIIFFNEVNSTKYQIPANVELIRRLMKANPKLSLDHFKSVIVHKNETWGNDAKMKEYNRPSTLFSSKFMKYLDDANHYWIQKHKHDSATQIIGN